MGPKAYGNSHDTCTSQQRTDTNSKGGKGEEYQQNKHYDSQEFTDNRQQGLAAVVPR